MGLWVLLLVNISEPEQNRPHLPRIASSSPYDIHCSRYCRCTSERSRCSFHMLRTPSSSASLYCCISGRMGSSVGASKAFTLSPPSATNIRPNNSKALACSFGSHSITSCPARFKLCEASCKARVTGGVGRHIPSFQSTAIFSFFFASTGRHGMGSTLGSSSQGCESTIAFEYMVMSSRVFAIGPLTLATASWPARPDVQRCVVKRPKDGRMVKMPVHEAGIRSEPPCWYVS
jgi:hypothetical protein